MWYAIVLYALSRAISPGGLTFYHPKWVELNVAKSTENVHISTSSHKTGRAQVWVPIGTIEDVDESSILHIRVKNSGVPLQVSVVFRLRGERDYYIKRILIPVTEKTEEFRITLSSYKKIFAPNVIERLKANTDAGLIIHFQNTKPGAIEFTLKEISITGGR